MALRMALRNGVASRPGIVYGPGARSALGATATIQIVALLCLQSCTASCMQLGMGDNA